MSVLGNRITELLEKQELSQREFSKMVGVTEVSMSRYIRNKRIPNINIIAKIARVLHTTSDYLLGIENKKNIDEEYYKIHKLISVNSKYMSISQKLELIEIISRSNYEIEE